jgi:hypothetical protein
LESQLSSGLERLQLPDEQRTALVTAVKDSAGGTIPALAADPRTAPVVQAARTALTDATRTAALTAAGFLAVGLAASTSLGRHTSIAKDVPAITPAGVGPPR